MRMKLIGAVMLGLASALCIFSLVSTLFSAQPKMPTSEILEIWEHSCIKHLKEGDINRALQVLNVMNWQCDNKQYFVFDGVESYVSAQEHLAEARKIRAENIKGGGTWICHSSRFSSQMQRVFVETVGKQVLDVLKTIGANESVAYVIVAQIALETSWGKRVFGDNLFNIKGRYNGESISFATHEQRSDGS